MRILDGLHQLQPPLSGAVLTIGNFDGVHLGHREIIFQAVELSKKYGVPAVVMTFDPHPSRVLRPENPVPRLFSLGDLQDQLSLLGVDVLIVEPFTTQFAQITAEDFITRHLDPALHPKEILVGYDFAFGHGREGSFTLLKKVGLELGFKVQRLEPVLHEGEIVSSSLIRQKIQKGLVVEASVLLGRPYFVEGKVVSGEGRGQSLGFSTANIATDAEVWPASGVYITHFKVDERICPSLTNVGYKPTFHKNHDLTIETHVLNANESFNGKKVQIEFLKRLRPELKFPSARELITQIEQDVSEGKKFFSM